MEIEPFKIDLAYAYNRKYNTTIAGVRGHSGVKEHTVHKPRIALPGRLAGELARTHNYIIQHIYLRVCIFMYICICICVQYIYGCGTRLWDNTQCIKAAVGITPFFLVF